MSMNWRRINTINDESGSVYCDLVVESSWVSYENAAVCVSPVLRDKLVESPCARWVGWWVELVGSNGGLVWGDSENTGPISNEFVSRGV